MGTATSEFFSEQFAEAKLDGFTGGRREFAGWRERLRRSVGPWMRPGTGRDSAGEHGEVRNGSGQQPGIPRGRPEAKRRIRRGDRLAMHVRHRAGGREPVRRCHQPVRLVRLPLRGRRPARSWPASRASLQDQGVLVPGDAETVNITRTFEESVSEEITSPVSASRSVTFSTPDGPTALSASRGNQSLWGRVSGLPASLGSRNAGCWKRPTENVGTVEHTRVGVRPAQQARGL